MLKSFPPFTGALVRIFFTNSRYIIWVYTFYSTSFSLFLTTTKLITNITIAHNSPSPILLDGLTPLPEHSPKRQRRGPLELDPQEQVLWPPAAGRETG